jgi:hypothetical protein
MGDVTTGCRRNGRSTPSDDGGWDAVAELPSPLGRTMKKTLFRTLRRIAGVLVLLAGIAGLFLPILQGILLIALGLHLLGIQPPLWVRERLSKIRRSPAPPTPRDRV